MPLFFEMKIMIAILFVLTAGRAMAQITIVDVVKVKAEHESEALFFYENNWKVFRERLCSGSSFRVLSW
jgi:hypothetical protein